MGMVQVMACHLFVTWAEYCQWHMYEKHFSEILIKTQTNSFTQIHYLKMYANIVYFLQGPISQKRLWVKIQYKTCENKYYSNVTYSQASL